VCERSSASIVEQTHLLLERRNRSSTRKAEFRPSFAVVADDGYVHWRNVFRPPLTKFQPP